MGDEVGEEARWGESVCVRGGGAGEGVPEMKKARKCHRGVASRRLSAPLLCSSKKCWDAAAPKDANNIEFTTTCTNDR